jgi:hypothetical protein
MLQRLLEQQYEQKAITESSLADLRQFLNDISEHVRICAPGFEPFHPS